MQHQFYFFVAFVFRLWYAIKYMEDKIGYTCNANKRENMLATYKAVYSEELFDDLCTPFKGTTADLYSKLGKFAIRMSHHAGQNAAKLHNFCDGKVCLIKDKINEINEINNN